ncbi:DUF397 domain-containing protein [Halostreptopolyspora alba]|uniref:DUF397 domain-containing protein n=1 Tax=Halostreptopolyspora alba TaxID=2487137 RepID=A0A3N0ECM5_9ACTN|nr:DUF397 domain-containing protein [Nocardiopsaceae bacterium YIM 96095]
MIDRTWRTSSYSNSKGGNCVEVAGTTACGVAVRDTRHREQGYLVFDSAAWAAFLREVRAGEM